MTAHTKGPWIVGLRYGNNRTEINSETETDKAIATVWTHDLKRISKPAGAPDDYGECPNGMANARLIAAAPELLEACRAAEVMIGADCIARDLLRSAILKATK